MTQYKNRFDILNYYSISNDLDKFILEINNPKNGSKKSKGSQNLYKRNNSVKFNNRNRNYTMNVINNEINNGTNMFYTIKE